MTNFCLNFNHLQSWVRRSCKKKLSSLLILLYFNSIKSFFFYYTFYIWVFLSFTPFFNFFTIYLIKLEYYRLYTLKFEPYFLEFNLWLAHQLTTRNFLASSPNFTLSSGSQTFSNTFPAHFRSHLTADFSYFFNLKFCQVKA